MIYQKFFHPLFFLFLLISSQEISKKCICGHSRSQIECQNSGFCIWLNGVCILNSSKTYIQEDQNQNTCKNYAEEDCRVQKQCGFYLSKCINFIDCSIFNKDYCQQSSYRCVSEGTKCVEMLECKNYKTEIGCANTNQNGKYCYWVQGIGKECRDITICEELPLFLRSHIMCKEGLDSCTVNEKGYGCIKQKKSCTQYLNDFQCFESIKKKDNCFWESQKGICVEKMCENLPFSQDYECKSYLSECTSNGIHCIQRKQCSDVQNKFGCVTDSQGNKCEYHQNQCKIKSCDTALSALTNYQLCQDYDNLLDCVPSENGGCKQRPQTCEGYVGQVECYSIQQQDCIWYNNKCEKRECFHAPTDYSQIDCKQYANCIGKVGGGCQETPDVCDNILQEQFCEYNYNKERCIWLEGVCTQFECNKLKLPTYKNHQICQQTSSNCTFNLDSLGCADYICENIFEIEFCSIDSQGTICGINQGCIAKKCNTAPSSYDKNQKCEEWLPYCTVNVQVLSNSKILIGCVNKMNECEVALEEQCYSTFSGIHCKWDKDDKICTYQVCTDADPNLYLTNQDCNSFKVSQGTCIIGSSDFGCQEWSNNCNQLISQQQCQLNLQDGTKCFWTGSLCKILECQDAPRINYTNNIECNSWLNYCIFNPNSGGCMNRSSSVACISSPNDSMYDTHLECQAWNPKCTVISSFNPQGCEQKKADCFEYIRQRNCKTNLTGQNCYWDDSKQKCYPQNDAGDCSKRIYGDLSHQNCENFLNKCTVSNLIRTCTYLSEYCDYKLEQQCVITKYYQPCKWDLINKRCKDVLCNENVTAQTEAECLNFRKFNQCQLKIQSNGTYGPGCESRPSNCEYTTNPIICKLTLTLYNVRCYFFNFKCQTVHSYNCEAIQDSKSNEVCQLYNRKCVLQQSGQGCYSINSCSDLSSNVCNSAIMKFNNKCNYYDRCRHDNDCDDKYKTPNACQNKKTALGQLCYFYFDCSYWSCRYCIKRRESKSLNFGLNSSLSDRRKKCQDYSSNYIYDTSCRCCVIMTSCNQQLGGYQLCNSSTVISRCGYNFQTNTCEDRKCEHLTQLNYSVITNQICYDWKYDCVLDITDCKTLTGDCTQIKLIQQCYSHSCIWQDDKCVKHVDCQINTTAVTNRECLFLNSDYCKFNYTKGIGCSFFNCDHINNETICNSSNLVDGQNCKWLNNRCYPLSCQDYTLQAQCESSYGYYYYATTKCFWCVIHTTQCSNHKYCDSNSLISPKSHEDCNNLDIQLTISFTISDICTVKKQFCSEYTYEDACVITLDGLCCYWRDNLCIDICQAANLLFFNPLTTLPCLNWNSNCILDIGSQFTILNCSLATTISKCNIYTTKCFWNGSNCLSIGACSDYSTSALCLNTNNLLGIPCFWDSTQCKEKTCQNIPTTPSSKVDCNNWLTNCQFNINNNSCIEDCTSAETSYTKHEDCESYYYNKSCTVKLDIIQCVDLPLTCDLAKETQCYQDRDGNQCYYQASTEKCLILSCSLLETDFTSHEKCNQKLKECTVNPTLNGCQYLNDCNSYLIQEQCYLDQHNIECEWIMSLNKCTIKECQTANLAKYTAHSCRQYFGDSCTVNKNLDGCEISQSFCMNYNYQQCTSEGLINLKGINCFWNEEKSICQERICENGPSNASSHSECVIFLSTCQKGGCRIKGCFDYYYAIDSACASIFEDKRCVTNGYQCILRKACEDINIIDGCTFDINLNPCVWIDEKCYTKTCQTAQVSLIKNEECNSYLQYCTVKQDGGCTLKQSCQDYQIKEACYTDSENFECIWDINLNKCFSNQCIQFCGDGIVSNIDEQCDDGNYLPYDGCYKCQVQCPQGCNICNGKLCEDCQKTGWQLVEGVCTSKCGDGYAVGNELCDDGNNIQFDGCYKCIYSCHEKCVDCFQGQCIQCENGFVEDGPQCYNICGDGYLVQQLEQCDDGNVYNNDGCSDTCKVENNWKCSTENNISFCAYVILPKITLTKLTKTDTSTQEFKLSFSEPVCLNEKGISEEQFLQLIFIEIINGKDNQYDVEIKSMISITTQLADVAYKVVINFKSNVKTPVLKVKINCENIVNIQGNTLLSNEAKLEFRSPYKISDDQQLLISKTSMLSRIVLYIIIIISGISFLCGNLEILWNLLDLLQQLSYMKFHNKSFQQIYRTNLKSLILALLLQSLINFKQTRIYRIYLISRSQSQKLNGNLNTIKSFVTFCKTQKYLQLCYYWDSYILYYPIYCKNCLFLAIIKIGQQFIKNIISTKLLNLLFPFRGVQENIINILFTQDQLEFLHLTFVN